MPDYLRLFMTASSVKKISRRFAFVSGIRVYRLTAAIHVIIIVDSLQEILFLSSRIHIYYSLLSIRNLLNYSVNYFLQDESRRSVSGQCVENCCQFLLIVCCETVFSQELYKF
jgi:hypothetical protein